MNSFPLRVASILASAILFAGCSPSVKHLRFNPLKDYYEANTAGDTTSRMGKNSWFTLRSDADQSIVRDSVTAADLITRYNSKDPARPKFSKININADLNRRVDRFIEFDAARYYFKGRNALTKGNCDSALCAFEKARSINSTLIFTSDIDYLRGVAFLRKSDSAMAANSFALFSALSESVYSPSFHLRKREPDSLYSGMLRAALVRSDSGFIALHDSTEKFHPWFDAPMYVPGFRFRETDSTGRILLGLGYSSNNKFLGAADIGYPLSSRTMPYFGGWADHHRSSLHEGILWRIFRNDANTFGVEGTAEASLTNITSEDFDGTAILPQPSFRLECGWFPRSRVSLFAGYYYPVFNQFNKWEDRSRLLWNDAGPYGGINLHLLGDLGLTGRYENGQWIAGLFMGYLVFGYGNKGMYVNISTW
jgi:hypothetical protein